MHLARLAAAAWAMAQCACRITHVVMPFSMRQIDGVARALRRIVAVPAQPGDSGPVHLVLYPSCPESEFAAKQLGVLTDMHKEALLESGLVDAVRWAGLTGDDDSYYNGSRLQFERLISGKIDLPPVHVNSSDCHVLYMEPDCQPVRTHWLQRLGRTIGALGDFYVAGSVLRANPDLVAHQVPQNRLHVNGNALYNLGPDPRDPLCAAGAGPCGSGLAAAYFYHVRPHAVKHGTARAYDTDMAQWALAAENAALAVRTVAPYVRFTDAIHNMYHTPYALSAVLQSSSRVVLLHGGTNTEDAAMQ